MRLALTNAECQCTARAAASALIRSSDPRVCSAAQEGRRSVTPLTGLDS